jgi:hypothetical protein
MGRPWINDGALVMHRPMGRLWFDTRQVHGLAMSRDVATMRLVLQCFKKCHCNALC